ncbi:hypothetical protein FGIG_00675 [Fasciola gigantica]|uniref:Uncharacterized protein n=1 Tax=Fasciola gigantica TaxID=46835 RepID=A0A504Y6Y2_FASGI|nr:hypothetical protein FGIG_00675 [Fasciola gigantica]
MDHNFYRFDVRVNNPFYSQCVTRHLSADLQSIEIEIWLVRHFIQNQCPQDQNDCVTQFVKNILRDPPENLPTLPFTLDAKSNNLRVEVLHTGQMNTACRQLQMSIQYPFLLLVLLQKIIFC